MLFRKRLYADGPEACWPCCGPGTPPLQDTSSLHPLKRCRPGGMLVDNDVKRRTGTKKYIDSNQIPVRSFQIRYGNFRKACRALD